MKLLLNAAATLKVTCSLASFAVSMLSW